MDDNDIPELEDFSEELKFTRKQQEMKSSVPIPVKVVETSSTYKLSDKPISIQKDKMTQQSAKTAIEESSSFGSGFKRGFFKKEAVEVKAEQTSSKNENKNDIVDLRHIKASSNKHEIKEVQEGMKNISIEKDNKFLMKDLMNKKDNWLNQDLLMKLAKNPKLIQAFTHPSFADVIALLQSNPQEAKRKYGDSKEFNEFFKEFFLLMSDHFKDLGKKETENFIQSSSQADPEVERVINDPQVKQLLEKMKIEGKIDSAELNSNPELAFKLDFLIKKGVLKTIAQ